MTRILVDLLWSFSGMFVLLGFLGICWFGCSVEFYIPCVLRFCWALVFPLMVKGWGFSMFAVGLMDRVCFVSCRRWSYWVWLLLLCSSSSSSSSSHRFYDNLSIRTSPLWLLTNSPLLQLITSSSPSHPPCYSLGIMKLMLRSLHLRPLPSSAQTNGKLLAGTRARKQFFFL